MEKRQRKKGGVEEKSQPDKFSVWFSVCRFAVKASGVSLGSRLPLNPTADLDKYRQTHRARVEVFTSARLPVTVCRKALLFERKTTSLSLASFPLLTSVGLFTFRYFLPCWTEIPGFVLCWHFICTIAEFYAESPCCRMLSVLLWRSQYALDTGERVGFVSMTTASWQHIPTTVVW